ncbi:hypothetical protein [Pseudomonas sp.]|jgi:hypothetical protein|uniref:hypothetical protein n=1 Tax=Gammaproteobacteria TaxID=1236 RepID=UPI0020618867|nr:hypothetical protein [Pseudomonas sp.]DAM52154.1 MAG TPA: Protein of unknown function (DUF2951) [Caudoviricetes sp.]
MDNQSEDIRELSNNVVRLQEQVATLQTAVKDLVTRVEFTPVKLIAYGLAGTILSSVLMAILSKVLMK